MRRSLAVLSTIATLLTVHTAAAQQRAVTPSSTPPPQLTAQSSYRVLPRTKNCTFGYQTVSTRYTVVGSTSFAGPPPHLVLEEKTSIEQCENLEGPNRADVSVVARPATNPAAAPAWTIRQHGDEGAVEERYGDRAMYRVTEFGCCGSENLDTYYSLTTGRRLFTADHPLLSIDAQPFGTGLVAVHDVQAAASPPGAESDRTLIAVVTFVPEHGAAQRVLVRGPSNDFMVDADSLQLVARGPGGAVKRGQQLGINDDLNARWTVAVVMWIEGMTEGLPAGKVEIPIEAGRLVPEKARGPAAFHVLAAPPR